MMGVRNLHEKIRLAKKFKRKSTFLSARSSQTSSKPSHLIIRKTEHNPEVLRSELFANRQQPKGYVENIIRLRKANDEKKRINQLREMQGMPQNYTGKMTKFEPFQLKTEDHKSKHNPGMIIEVTIGPGKKGKS